MDTPATPGSALWPFGLYEKPTIHDDKTTTRESCIKRMKILTLGQLVAAKKLADEIALQQEKRETFCVQRLPQNPAFVKSLFEELDDADMNRHDEYHGRFLRLTEMSEEQVNMEENDRMRLEIIHIKSKEEIHLSTASSRIIATPPRAEPPDNIDVRRLERIERGGEIRNASYDRDWRRETMEAVREPMKKLARLTTPNSFPLFVKDLSLAIDSKVAKLRARDTGQASNSQPGQ
ncbi:hypothetical protein GGR57DRAFT_512513 [Xylariaceae sp. FL1272]|nr:hypothetical protein GGR57DRAFT_512513 [Xylariaceae sp. FL1272]